MEYLCHSNNKDSFIFQFHSLSPLVDNRRSITPLKIQLPRLEKIGQCLCYNVEL